MYDLGYPYEYEEGREAFKAGHCLTANPYQKNTDEYDQWVDGWEYQSNLLKHAD